MRLILGLADRSVEVTRPESVVGRAPECDVLLADKSVSRHHAVIVLSALGARVRDLGSRNGTAINGILLGSDRRLNGGDVLRFGCVDVRVTALVGEEGDRDDGWLAVQAALLVKHSTGGHTREADEVVFRIAEAFEARFALGERFSADVTDAALAAVIDYAMVRNRPGWTRWVMGTHAKLGIAPGVAVRRSLDGTVTAEETQQVRTSGTMPRATLTGKRQVG